jgi:hypothetical protein
MKLKVNSFLWMTPCRLMDIYQYFDKYTAYIFKVEGKKHIYEE